MQQPVKRIVKEFTNTTRWPVSWLELECGHTAKAHLREEPDSRIRYGTAFEHVDANHLVKPGDLVECECCVRYQSALAMLRAVDPATISHSRFRHHDSRGFGPGSLYVYKRHPKSPTGVELWLTIDGRRS